MIDGKQSMKYRYGTVDMSPQIQLNHHFGTLAWILLEGYDAAVYNLRCQFHSVGSICHTKSRFYNLISKIICILWTSQAA